MSGYKLEVDQIWTELNKLDQDAETVGKLLEVLKRVNKAMTQQEYENIELAARLDLLAKQKKRT